MRPSFTLLRMGYPKSEKREALFESLGWSDITKNDAYKDTCAIRMSVALSRAGVTLTGGTMKVQAGRLKGTRIETRQRALSKMLKRLWGEPEVYRTEKDATEAIGKRSGVISFFRIGGGARWTYRPHLPWSVRFCRVCTELLLRLLGNMVLAA